MQLAKILHAALLATQWAGPRGHLEGHLLPAIEVLTVAFGRADQVFGNNEAMIGVEESWFTDGHIGKQTAVRAKDIVASRGDGFFFVW
jgi:hypothetical protein